MRGLPLGLGGAVVALALVACGEEDRTAKTWKPHDLAIEITGSAANAEFAVPRKAEAGVTRIEVENGTGSGEHSVQLIRIQGDHTPEQALGAANAWASRGAPLPDWVQFEGGVPTVAPGSTATSTQNLPAGNYVVVDLEGEQGEAKATLTVSGEPPKGEGLPAPRGRVNASEYTFRSAGLAAGRAKVLIDNQGRQPHHLVAAPIRPGRTLADVRRGFRSRNGRPPIDRAAARRTPILDTRRRQVVELELREGRYALICFVPDRKGGPPHAVKGMIAPAEVR